MTRSGRDVRARSALAGSPINVLGRRVCPSSVERFEGRTGLARTPASELSPVTQRLRTRDALIRADAGRRQVSVRFPHSHS